MNWKRVILLIVLLCVALFGVCSGENTNNELELERGMVVSGETNIREDCAVVLHFSTFQKSYDGSELTRALRASSQFLCCDSDGALTNAFLVNREILCNPVVKLKSSISIGFLDCSLICSPNGINFFDNSSSLDLSKWTGKGPTLSGYIDEYDTAYFLFNLGTGPIKGQYSTVLRFVNSQTSYDVVIPHPITYVAYDSVNRRFVYRVSAPSDEFLYGFIDYDAENNRYQYNTPNEPISIETTVATYGDWGKGGYRALCVDNVVYEILTIPVNERVIEDLHLSSDYLDNSECWWGVLVLSCFNLSKNTIQLEYLTSEPFAGDLTYGFVMFGTEQMPAYATNGKLYFFTCDEYLNVYDPQWGFTRYDVKFDTTETLSPSNLFSKDSQGDSTLGDGSPIKIFNDGNLYTAHAYSDGTIKIHKYNFSDQCFELYWTSASGIFDALDKKSLEFVSFELTHCGNFS